MAEQSVAEQGDEGQVSRMKIFCLFLLPALFPKMCCCSLKVKHVFILLDVKSPHSMKSDVVTVNINVCHFLFVAAVYFYF